MALERQGIEKKDFPIGRRGYDPEAVDAHLRAIADEVEGLRNSSPRRTETLASAASDRVRAIVEAAETSAAEIQRQAEEEAHQIRAEAGAESTSARETAAAEAREYLGKVSEATAAMLQRLDAMESELGALLESLRTGSNRLTADLQLLETNLGDVRHSVTPRAGAAPEAPAAPELPLKAAVEPTAAGAAEPQVPSKRAEVQEFDVDEAPARAGSEVAPARAGTEAAAEPSGNGGDDTEGARLIALNMALNGTPRDETERYLAENFELADSGALLDEVYASVEG